MVGEICKVARSVEVNYGGGSHDSMRVVVKVSDLGLIEGLIVRVIMD